MATIWARSNGNWDGSIWNWDNNGTIEAYPYSTPRTNDIVYSNGYIVTLNVYLISCATLTNRLNPYTNRRGGYFSTTSQISVGFNCNLLADSTYLINFNTTSDRHWSLNGNIEGGEVYTGGATNCVIYKASSNTNALIVNGNVDGRNSNAIFGGSGSSLIPYTINGNVTINYKLSVGLNINMISEINGNFTKLTDGDFQTGGTIGSNNGLVVRGNVYGDMTFGSIKSTITIDGGYYYLTSFKLPLNKLVATYPQTIIYRYVGTEPNPNPYLVVNAYTLNNTYPVETNVKKDVRYGSQDELVGQYLPDYPPESVVLKDFVYDTIIAEENDIATYNAVRYIYADYGTLHWFELKTTTTDIVTDPTSQSIDIDGDTVVADTDYVVEYNDVCYQWSGSAWGSITTKNIGTIKTDIATNLTETTLSTKKGTLETSNMSQQLISRLENCATVETVQQLLVAHLDN